jgi:nitric oxide reductase NorD protein
MRSAFNRILRGLKRYFGKSDPQDGHRCKTPLADVHRRLAIYLYAMCGREIVIKAMEEDFIHLEKYMPYIERNAIHLPSFYYDRSDDVSGLDAYRAAAVHAAAHLMHTEKAFPDEGLTKWQKAVISVVEDARVETLMMREFPGLIELWRDQHVATPMQSRSAGDYLSRLARALLDEAYLDEDPWVVQGRALFGAEKNLGTHDVSIRIGLTLASEFRKKNLKFNPHADRQSALYRDDNRYAWEFAKHEPTHAEEMPTSFFELKLLMGNNEFASADEENKEIVEDKPRGSNGRDTYSYAEWDYRSQAETASWVTVREKKLKPGELEVVSNIVAQNGHLITRMEKILHAIRYSGLRRIRKLEEGDEIDVNAAIRALTDLRSGVQPDTRIMMRSLRKNRDISVLVLLDLSNSTNQKIAGQEQTVLDLTRQICVLFADVIEDVGDPFAIHGFCSKSRHNVEYFRFKDFGKPYDDLSRARIAGMTGQRSTRMGAAIRHATHQLNEQDSGKKLLMLITDGAPSDIDVRGTKYLMYDAKMAVKEAGKNGIHTHCITLDPKADEYVSQIFGARGYMVVDHVRYLPEKMLMIYAGLTR